MIRTVEVAAKHPEISVIIPTCDRPDLLGRALDSVQRQTSDAHEIIIIDNGVSPVNLNRMNSRVIIHRAPPRIGPSKARNIGSRMASGTHVAFLDDDDYWNVDYIRYVKQSIYRNPSAIHVATIVNLDGNGREIDTRLFKADPSSCRRVYYRNPHFGGSNFVISRSHFLEIGGFDESFEATEDRDLFATLLEDGATFVSAPNAVTYAVHHSGPRSQDKQLKGNLQMFLKHYKYMTFREKRTVLLSLTRRYLTKCASAFRGILGRMMP